VKLTVGRRGGRSWVRAEPIMAEAPERGGLPPARGGGWRRGGGGSNGPPAKRMGAADVKRMGQKSCGWQPCRGRQTYGFAGWPRRRGGIVGSGRRGPRRTAVGMAVGALQWSRWSSCTRRPTSLTPDSLDRAVLITCLTRWRCRLGKPVPRHRGR